MRLTDAQVAEFRETGCLFFPALFNPVEIGLLRAGLPALLERDGTEVVREKDDPLTARLVYGAHAFDEAYRRVTLHPRVLDPVRQLLAEPVYIHQTRLNPKQAFSGGAWSWHQDFGTWHRADGMPAPKCVMTAVFLDDSTAVNSPLLIVPGSQHHGLVEEVTPEDVTGYVLMEIDRPTLQRLAGDGGVRALTGPAGSVAFLHCNIVHGSAPNISPLRRAIWYVNYNAVSNACIGTERSWYHNNRDFAPLEPLAEDCLAGLLAPAAQ